MSDSGKLTKAYYVECGWCDRNDVVLAGKYGLTKAKAQKTLRNIKGWSTKKR